MYQRFWNEAANKNNWHESFNGKKASRFKHQTPVSGSMDKCIVSWLNWIESNNTKKKIPPLLFSSLFFVWFKFFSFPLASIDLESLHFCNLLIRLYFTFKICCHFGSLPSSARSIVCRKIALSFHYCFCSRIAAFSFPFSFLS